MTKTQITPDQDAVISEIEIADPPERVFKAISDPEEIRRRSPEIIRHEGEILELDPGCLRNGHACRPPWYFEIRPQQSYRGFNPKQVRL